MQGWDAVCLPMTPYNMARKCGNAYPYFLGTLAHLTSKEQPL